MQKTVLGLGGDTCFEFQIILSYCLVFPSFCSVISAAANEMNTFSCNVFVIWIFIIHSLVCEIMASICGIDLVLLN